MRICRHLSALRSVLVRRSFATADCNRASTRCISPASFASSSVVRVRTIHTSSLLDASKNRKPEKEKQPSRGALATDDSALSRMASVSDEYVAPAVREMRDLEERLVEHLAKHFSLQVDLRLYEEMLVDLDDGERHPMSHLGRVSLKSPRLVMINFADNPRAIKAAKIAIEKSALNVNPQMEGICLFLPIPRMSRDRREKLCMEAEKKILNDYKSQINKIYLKHDAHARKEKIEDKKTQMCAQLLQLKRAMDARGAAVVYAKQEDLMREVV